MPAHRIVVDWHSIANRMEFIAEALQKAFKKEMNPKYPWDASLETAQSEALEDAIETLPSMAALIACLPSVDEQRAKHNKRYGVTT